ncbi:MAG: flagellar export chaperone FliS [Francisellaceae bacterium]|mgnify:CR=1 FL=1|jgi:flagellar secretion chaperone FliS|nr:flagellar export chaperone FliS [Francisellaceae bacterium]MBT6539064.1 flagellar export chaperone FliS [Francisellaceae bacterium]
MSKNAIDSYASIKKQNLKEDKSTYEIVSLLLQGLEDKLTTAVFCIKTNNIARKGEAIGVAVSLLEALKMSLNKEVGGEIAENLELLYDFSIRELTDANIDNSVEKVENVLKVIGNIKSGWDGIESQVKK